jgi:hypothetical protein
MFSSLLPDPAVVLVAWFELCFTFSYNPLRGFIVTVFHLIAPLILCHSLIVTSTVNTVPEMPMPECNGNRNHDTIPTFHLVSTFILFYLESFYCPPGTKDYMRAWSLSTSRLTYVWGCIFHFVAPWR